MTLSEELTWRGFVNQTTFDDIKQLDGEPLKFYFGVDPSADSMHIGQLAMAMMIRHFIAYGHKATLLVGGATGMIGDPDGKMEERELKSLEEVERNKAGIAGQYRSLFEGREFEVVDNYDWFKDINYLDFLRTVGKYVPLSQMLGRDFIQARLGEGGNGISYAEFSYALIQGYDFLHLFRDRGITLQIAGADQWGNSVTGVQLIRRLEGAESHVWTAPLIINKATGKKFGKSEAGAVWLDAKKTSVYKFYQFWLNVDDAGAIGYLKIYTLLSQDDIMDLVERQQANPGAREAQKTLAYEVTKLVHGQDRTESVMRVTDVLFGSGDFANLTTDDLDALAAEIMTVSQGMNIVDALQKAGLASSNGEARRLIAGGAVSINGKKVNEDRTIDEVALVKKGKNNFILVRS
jgi:tyrosyl-tRNA synthetase